MLAWFGRIYGLRYATLRYFNVAGALAATATQPAYGEAHEPESHLIPILLDVALGRRTSIGIYGDDYPTPDGTCIRDYIHVADLADAHLLAHASLAKQPAALYNLGNGRGFSVREVVEAARSVTGHAIPVEQHPAPPRRPCRARRLERQSAERTRLEAAISCARRHPRQRLGLAPATA